MEVPLKLTLCGLVTVPRELSSLGVTHDSFLYLLLCATPVLSEFSVHHLIVTYRTELRKFSR